MSVFKRVGELAQAKERGVHPDRRFSGCGAPMTETE